MGIADEIDKLDDLKRRGAITEAEFRRAKDALLSRTERPRSSIGDAVDRASTDSRMWAMLIHFSQFCGYVVPLAGFIVPIIMWQVKKGESQFIDTHGRIVANWLVSELIYLVISVALSVIVIGIPLLITLVVVGIVFPIIGGIKANDGHVWVYPASMRLFLVDEVDDGALDSECDRV
jgi:uncharacterized Tic20 family protein